jgi:hypothetical protein
LSAGPKSGSSFTWQSILAGLATFKHGYIWRVGNGDRIKIWEDPWIPARSNRKILSSRGGAVYTRVCEPISPITGQWDEDLLKRLFCPIDVRRILQIPINNQGFDDFIAWHHTKHGRYTVKSGYHLQWRHQFGPSAGQISSPGPSAINPVWKNLWKMKIPGKVKVFIWRALHGVIPLKAILANRHIGTSGACPIRNQGAEDVIHMLFTCSSAQDHWRGLGLLDTINEAIIVDRAGSGVLEYLLQLPDSSLQMFDCVGLKELISVTSWYLWWLRRRRSRGESVPPVYKCKMSILAITANAAKGARD